MNFKKTLALFLSLSFAVSLFSVSALASKNNEDRNTIMSDNEYPITVKTTSEDGQVVYHKYAYNPSEEINICLFKKKMEKTIKLNYTSTNDIPNSKYWEEYHDGIWYEGYLDYVSHKKIYDGIWQVTFTGTLYENKNK